LYNVESVVFLYKINNIEILITFTLFTSGPNISLTYLGFIKISKCHAVGEVRKYDIE